MFQNDYLITKLQQIWVLSMRSKFLGILIFLGISILPTIGWAIIPDSSHWGLVSSYTGNDPVTVYAHADGEQGVWGRDDDNLTNGYYLLNGPVDDPATSFEDEGATNGAKVIFRYTDTMNENIQAVLASQTGTVRSGDSVRTDLTPLALSTDIPTPANLKATPGGPSTNKIILTWDADNDPDISGYYVFRSANDTKHFEQIGTLLPAGSVSFEDTNAPGGTLFYYFVRAIDSDTGTSVGYRDGPPSQIVSTDSALPIGLSGFMATWGSEAVVLRWWTSSELENLGFHVYRAKTPNGPFQRITGRIIPGAGTSGAEHHYSYIDSEVKQGQTYFYYLEDISYDGTSRQSDIIQIDESDIIQTDVGVKLFPEQVQSKPIQSRLLQNFPNPYNPETWIPYELAENMQVTLSIYNSSGQLVKVLDLGTQAPGYYTTKDKAAYWDGRNQKGESMPSGLYFYSIQAGDYTATRRMLLLK